jgi:DUF1365 family protein
VAQKELLVTDTKSSIYYGEVVHHRFRPKTHRLRYKVFSLLLDIDELEDLAKRSKLLSYNQRAFYSIHDKDHGYGENISDWIRNELKEAGLSNCSTTIQMLCYPRILGYVFNPLTVFFCYRKNAELGAIVYEVHNTFKERHCYVLPVAEHSTKIIKQRCTKDFYVSPFVPDSCTYNFLVQAPQNKVSVVIKDEDKDGLLLVASFAGVKGSLNDHALLKTIISYPLMTFKVIIGIHFEALKLIIKRAPFFPHKRYVKQQFQPKNSLKPLRQFRR